MPWIKRKVRVKLKRDKPRRKRPELFFMPERDPRFLDARSYVTQGGRVRLFGEDMQRLRARVFRESLNAHHVPICQCGCGQPAPWNASLDSRGELSHNEHGPWKSDELDRVKWMRHECHMRLHNPKAIPSRLERDLRSGRIA